MPNIQLRQFVIMDSVSQHYFQSFAGQRTNDWLMTPDKRRAMKFDDHEHARNECQLLVRVDPKCCPLVCYG